jgi:hypothetical protein
MNPPIGWTGWLWLDASEKPLTTKVAHAAKAYAAKFGQQPDVCYVHPGAVEAEERLNGLVVVPARNVLVHHFWVGVMEREKRMPDG